VLDYCFTRRANPGEAETILGLLRRRCASFGTEVMTSDGLFERVPATAGA
jgi:hypothetical protein